jgi:hypothetical protein
LKLYQSREIQNVADKTPGIFLFYVGISPGADYNHLTDPKINAIVKNIIMMHSSSLSQKSTCSGADRY